MTEPALYIHLTYQQAFLSDPADVKIIEKSRRIGISWAVAHDRALDAAEVNGHDTFYIGTSKEMARDFIDDAANFARTLDASIRAFEIEEEVFKDADRDINVFRLKFASGHKVEALSSNPSNLRSHKGGARVVIDEAAFHDDYAGMLKAVMAHLIWGGKVMIISSHNGDDNPFNETIKLVRAGKLPYSVHRVDLDDALAQGLYKRICMVTGREWSPEAEAVWRDDLIKKYGDNADEELFCIPSRSGTRYFSRALVENCMKPGIPIYRYKCSDEFTFMSDAAREASTLNWLRENVIIPKTEGSIFAGEDFARSGDLSELWIFERTKTMHMRCLFVIEMRNVPFSQQEQINRYVLDAFRNFRSAGYDARGNGQYLAERMAQAYGPSRIHQVALSQQWYRDNMPRYKARLEDKTITLPLDEDILDDHRTVALKNGIPMVVEHTGDADGKRHGDSVIACVLADYAERNDDGDYLEPNDVQSAPATDRSERIAYNAY